MIPKIEKINDKEEPPHSSRKLDFTPSYMTLGANDA